MSDVVAVGIAGLGRAGWNLHALTLESLPEKYKVVAVSDQNQNRLQEAQQRFNCQTYADFDQILADKAVELVVVALPSHLHADYAIKALQAGKHVMIEKPFATDLKSADRMIEVARQSEGILTGSQNLRFTADYLKLVEIITSGKLGRIHTVRIAWHWFRRRWDWQTIQEFGGGSLNNDGSHVIDQALLFG